MKKLLMLLVMSLLVVGCGATGNKDEDKKDPDIVVKEDDKKEDEVKDVEKDKDKDEEKKDEGEATVDKGDAIEYIDFSGFKGKVYKGGIENSVYYVFVEGDKTVREIRVDEYMQATYNNGGVKIYNDSKGNFITDFTYADVSIDALIESTALRSEKAFNLRQDFAGLAANAEKKGDPYVEINIADLKIEKMK